MIIRKYNSKSDEVGVFNLIKNEEGWDYAEPNKMMKYKIALETSVTVNDDEVYEYSRSLNDFDTYIYVCDLLVKPSYRGQNLGKQLMLCIQKDFPEHTVYVMSDEDGYYDKVGFSRVGSIYEVR